MKKYVLCMLVTVTSMLVLGGCNEPVKGIDLRNEGLVMRIPFAGIDGYVYYVEQLEGGKFKYNDKEYDIDGIFQALGNKQYSMNKRGVCLKTVGDMKKEQAVIDRFATFCIDKNMDMFLDLPYPEDLAKPENMDWIIQHRTTY